MDQNGYAIQYGGVNGSNGALSTNGPRRKQARVLTVDEALPYSPFSSVVPFNSDIIPPPSIGLRSSTSLFSTPTDREEGRQLLEALNRDAQDPNNTSERLQKSLNDLKELLKPGNIAQYSFKTSPSITSEHTSNSVQPQTSLSAFAQMVYDRTSVEFRYPSPERPSPPIMTSRPPQKQKGTPKLKSHPKPQQPPQPISIQRAVSNQQAYDENSTIKVEAPTIKEPPRSNGHISTPTKLEPETPAKPSSSFSVIIPGLPKNFSRTEYTPSKSETKVKPVSQTPKQDQPQVLIQPNTPSQQQSHTPLEPTPKVTPQHGSQLAPSSSIPGLAVVIPNLPSTFRPEDYEVLPSSPDTPQNLSRKRRRSEVDDEDDLSRSVDQRQKNDAAFKNLREYLQEVFEAEDQVQPDHAPSSVILTSSSEGITLSLAAQAKVEILLQRVIDASRFSQIPLDDLLRVQKLCEGALKVAETVDVKVDDSMGESEVETWLQQISTAELGIKAARVSLKLMAGGREEKQLYSEDVIQAALNAFKNATETCLIPIVEMRNSGPSAAVFKLLSVQKAHISSLLSHCRKLLSLVASLVSTIELSETVINTLEFTASRLIFVENAPSERDSIVKISKFDSLRVVAMDVLAQIFLCNPAQRQGIFDEILTSLEKLPVTRQSARQFKLAEGGSIQLVSALIMRLIQTSACKVDDDKSNRRHRALEALNGDDSTDELKEPSTSKYTITAEHDAERQPVTAIQELADDIGQLLDTAKANATYVVAFIVNRAMKSTKSGDAPYRNLLDLFVEDFITCLNSTDWPAAELMLRLFLFKMVQLAEGDKTAAPAKNMALDLLGLMGAAISELNSHVRKTANSLENGDTDLGRYLAKLAEASLEKKASGAELVSWGAGPYRACLESLQHRCRPVKDDDPQLRSAIGFFKAEWASKVCITFDAISDDDYNHEQTEQEYGRLAYRLRMMISDRRWLSTEYSFEAVSPPHARLAYSITLLNSQFCESFSRVFSILLGSMTSEQATVRSKSLKSVNQVLDTDPAIIDREPAVKQRILRCANDTSVQVRDSALGLIGKCINIRPALEEEMITHILSRVNDSGVGVRKRAMRLSKDIYLRNNKREVRSLIADALLHRVQDLDEGVQDLARQMIEEVWMSPFYQSTTSENTTAQYKLAMSDHVALMVKTVQRGGGVGVVLDKVLQNILSADAKLSGANFRVCKALVATMFETIIDNSASESNDAPSARDAMHILTIFAKSNADLFTAEQVQLLQPYVANVRGNDDPQIYRSVIVIFRHVLSHLSKAHNNFLASIRKELLPAVARVGKSILDDIIACLWIISGVLGDYRQLTALVISSLDGISRMKNTQLADDQIRKLTKLLLITGMCGKHCDFDPQTADFRKKFPSWKDDSVAKLMADTFAPFASPSQPLEVRKAALEAIGMVCQSWPKNFSSANIYTSFLTVFDEKEAALETIVLKSFKDFLLLEEKRSEAGKDGVPGAGIDSTAKLGVMGGGQGDGIAIGIAQRFLPHIVRIALSRQDDQGLLAAEVVASIARQGLVHPKETGSCLIALETSQNLKIAEIAAKEHRALHEKHETILEKEYMRAVQLAYAYQRDIVRNTHGANIDPYASKLHLMMDVLKISKVKNRKRFYENLCARIEFDPAKMDIVTELPQHLEFSQFIIENLAFFEYQTVDELLSTITAMEKVVAALGTGIAHSIETEIFHVSLDQPSQVDEHGQSQPVQPTVDQLRLQQLTASSMMLSSLWEARSYLRRQYGLKTNLRDGKNKAAIKDLNRAPVRAQGVNGDKFWELSESTMSSLDSEESMMKQCRAFVELLNVDQEFKVAAEDDEEADQARASTPSEDEGASGTPGPPGSGRGRKRKGSISTPGNRKKRARSSSVPRGRGRPKGPGKKQSVERSDDEGDGWN
ncbi:Sister chromatid cohesion protein 2 [Cadophora gregata]|uniref:Sister chromatid cohesion protein 2 n=1 Tax=Cadophora gregata TaxID=51156 RepID=UPI0026DBE26C|nr:Sister chromatid cohesion protein 2 [Cadophora gregata]KAK0119687.1 Sister chromatid cohesion protein 2 [Cadophora gregata]KAK0120722.1 Sister chromatid cohesion protein 2 [Cadophora gregata f. sp. sojae]